MAADMDYEQDAVKPASQESSVVEKSILGVVEQNVLVEVLLWRLKEVL